MAFIFFGWITMAYLFLKKNHNGIHLTWLPLCLSQPKSCKFTKKPGWAPHSVPTADVCLSLSLSRETHPRWMIPYIRPTANIIIPTPHNSCPHPETNAKCGKLLQGPTTKAQIVRLRCSQTAVERLGPTVNDCKKKMCGRVVILKRDEREGGMLKWVSF